jgi:CBS domain-containing protein
VLHRDDFESDAFPVLAQGKLQGVINAEILRTITADPHLRGVAIAHDLMQPPLMLRETDNLQTALDMILTHGVRKIVVVDANHHVIGVLDDAEIACTYRAEGNAAVPPKQS